MPVIGDATGRGFGVAGEGVEGGDDFCGIHAAGRFLGSVYVYVCGSFE